MKSKKTKPDEYVDVYSSSKKQRSSKKKSRQKKSNTSEVIIAGVCICLVLSLIVTSGLAYVIRDKLGKINYSDGFGGNPDVTFNYIEEENLNFHNIADPNGAETVKELIKTWATNGGDKLYSKNVINVLLVGEDSEDGTSRSDSTILVTVNKKQKKIYLTSFLRDSYTYMNIDGQDRYDKTNHSYSWGGPAKLMEVLSNNYKITIDHFVTINYESFISAVDALGGINVMVTEAEADYMNRTTRIKGFESGPNVNLDGEHALVFARIRKLDGEEQRTERQRRLITSVIKSVKDSTLSDMNSALDNFLPYITTNYRENEVFSLATKAIKEGWLKYDIVSSVAPSEATKMGFRGYRTYTGNLDVWIVDYVRAAQELQLALYGQTNITIDESTHVSAIDLAMGKSNNVESNGDEIYEEESTTGKYDWLYDRNFTRPEIEIPSFNPENLPDLPNGFEDFTHIYNSPTKENSGGEYESPENEYE